VLGEIATGNYFTVLGVRPYLGRGFLPEDDQSPGTSPVAVISYRLWERRFGASADVTNQVVTINGTHFNIVGVAPREFTGTFVGYAPDIWVPAMMAGQVKSATALTNEHTRWLNLTGRLKDGVSPDASQANLTLLYKRLGD
jgi:hypothetical protein